jgi:hypothetical protein
MTPAQLHINFGILLSTGILAISTVGAPSVHGAVVTGIHGMGVSTPIAAEVAAATVGLARLMHAPNGMIFTMGLLSIILAAGMFAGIVRFTGKTIRLDGAIPKLHSNIAPEHTCIDIKSYLLLSAIN